MNEPGALPNWIAKFLRRLMGLQPGRYVIVLSVQPGRWDWSVQPVGKIEEVSGNN